MSKPKRKSPPRIKKVEDTIDRLANLMAGKPEPFRMEFQAYTSIKELIEQAEGKLERDYLTACQFIPIESSINYEKTAIAKANAIFHKELGRLRRMKESLHSAAALTYKDHPNKEMRKFWGVE
jgi:hypothetical protein